MSSEQRHRRQPVLSQRILLLAAQILATRWLTVKRLRGGSKSLHADAHGARLGDMSGEERGTRQRLVIVCDTVGYSSLAMHDQIAAQPLLSGVLLRALDLAGVEATRVDRQLYGDGMILVLPPCSTSESSSSSSLPASRTVWIA